MCAFDELWVLHAAVTAVCLPGHPRAFYIPPNGFHKGEKHSKALKVMEGEKKYRPYSSHF
jgi:hypothetical protein